MQGIARLHGCWIKLSNSFPVNSDCPQRVKHRFFSKVEKHLWKMSRHQFVALCSLEAQWNRSENLDGSACNSEGVNESNLRAVHPRALTQSGQRLVKSKCLGRIDLDSTHELGMCKTGLAKCAKSFSLFYNAKSTFLYRWEIGLEAPELSPATDLREWKQPQCDNTV